MPPSRIPIARSVPGLVLAALLVAASASRVLAADLVLKGRVVDGRGFPLGESKVYLEGAKKTAVGVDRDGWYTLKLSVPPIEQLARSPLAFTVFASRKGWNVALQSGAGTRLMMEVSAVPDTDHALAYRLRSNDVDAASSLAGVAVLEGEVAGTMQVHFVGVPGEQTTSEDKLTAEQKVRIAGSNSVATGPPPGTTAGTPPPTPKPSPNPAMPPPLLTPITRAAVPTYAPGCTCQVHGTVEVVSPRLNEPLDVVVWLESAPRDSQRVEMFLGSPREFNLVARGCGSHRIRWATRRSGKQLYQVTREVVVDCTDRSPRQPRLILEPYYRKR